jgi:sugar phosphate isomerase/epimerase
LYALYVGATIEQDKLVVPPNLDEVFAAVAKHGTIVWLYVPGKGVKPSDAGADAVAVPAFRAVAEQAKRHGVSLALYPHNGMWVQTTADAIRVANAVDRPNFGLSFNLCHALKAGEGPQVADLLRQAGKRLFVVTLNGADADDAKSASWDKLIQPLGRGSYDPKPMLAQLQTQGYAGPIGFQGYGIKEEPAKVLAETMEAWRRMSKHE